MKQKQGMMVTVILAVSVIIVATLIAVGFLAYNKSESGVKRKAVKDFTKYINKGDYGSAYKMLHFPDNHSDFLTWKNFQEFAENHLDDLTFKKQDGQYLLKGERDYEVTFSGEGAQYKLDGNIFVVKCNIDISNFGENDSLIVAGLDDVDDAPPYRIYSFIGVPVSLTAQIDFFCHPEEDREEIDFSYCADQDGIYDIRMELPYKNGIQTDERELIVNKELIEQEVVRYDIEQLLTTERADRKYFDVEMEEGEKESFAVVYGGDFSQEGFRYFRLPAEFIDDGKAYPALKVYDCAFMENTKINVLIIDEPYQAIGKAAFAGCTGLRYVYLAPSLTLIERDAFYGCDLNVVFIVQEASEAEKFVEQRGYRYVVVDGQKHVVEAQEHVAIRRNMEVADEENDIDWNKFKDNLSDEQYFDIEEYIEDMEDTNEVEVDGFYDEWEEEESDDFYEDQDGMETAVITVANGETAPASDFVFPYSSEKLLTEEDLNTLLRDNIEDMRLISQRAINEIFARYGFIFKGGKTRTARECYDFLNSKEWYLEIKGSCSYEASNDLITHMNETEQKNIDILYKWQLKHIPYAEEAEEK